MTVRNESMPAPGTSTYRERYERMQIRQNFRMPYNKPYDELDRLFADRNLSLEKIARKLCKGGGSKRSIARLKDKLCAVRRQFYPTRVGWALTAVKANRQKIERLEKMVRSTRLFRRLEEFCGAAGLSVSPLRSTRGYSDTVFNIGGLELPVRFTDTPNFPSGKEYPYARFLRGSSQGVPRKFVVLIIDIKGRYKHREVLVIPWSECPEKVFINLDPQRFQVNSHDWTPFMGENGSVLLKAAVEEVRQSLAQAS